MSEKKSGFVLFKNKYKKNDSHPDYTGEVTTPNGETFRMAAWVKEGKDGKDNFLAGSVEVPEPKGEEVPKKEPDDENLSVDDSSLPF